MRKSESQIQNEIRGAVNSSGKAILWRNNTGKRQIEGRWLIFGLAVGSADLVGLIIGTGQMLCIEVKAALGKPSPEQIAWGKTITKAGGIYAVCRDSASAMKVVLDASSRRC